MEKEKQKTLKDMKIVFNPNSNELFTSKLGNDDILSLFRLIVDPNPNTPEITQRIYYDNSRNNY